MDKMSNLEDKTKKLGYNTGKIIKIERIELNNITQKELGEKIGEITGIEVKRQTISNWEKGLISTPLSPYKKRPILLSPKMLRKADVLELYGILCKFVDKQRKKNGLSTSDEL